MTDRKLTVIAALVLTALSAPAQTRVDRVLPGTPAGPGQGSYLSLFDHPCTTLQLVIGAAHLSGLEGASIEAATLRSLNALGMPAEKGAVRLVLRLSRAASPPAGASPRFAQNRGSAAITLFDGVVNLAGLPPYGGSGPTPWGDPRNLKLAFTRAYPYAGGDLCLEIESRAVPGKERPLWHCDGLIPANLPPGEKRFGQATPGAPPSFMPMRFGIPAPGESFPVALGGVVPQSPTLLVLGISKSAFGPVPLPLPVAWTEGRPVWLNVSPDLVLPGTARPLPPVEDLEGRPLASQPPDWYRRGWAESLLAVPWTPAMSGCTLYAQWFAVAELDLGSHRVQGLAATAGIEVDLAASGTGFDLACLYAVSDQAGSPPTEDPHPTLRFAPVLRLEGRR